MRDPAGPGTEAASQSVNKERTAERLVHDRRGLKVWAQCGHSVGQRLSATKGSDVPRPTNVWRYWFGHNREGGYWHQGDRGQGAANHLLVCRQPPAIEHDQPPNVQLLRPRGRGQEGRGHRDGHSQGQGEKPE